MVFPYVESHNFYVEHWYHTIFWNKVREFGALLARHDFVEDAEDIFYLQRHEVSDALVDLRLAWAAGSEGRGAGLLAADRRRGARRSWRRCGSWTPPPALGAVPEAITEPMTIMLWGITTERVREWAAADRGDGATLSGFAGSAGTVEGPARVVLDVARLGELQDGEILVAPVTSPSWTPVFGKIAAAVSDIGGMMSHAAIVSREYGVPAVVGTGGRDEPHQDRRPPARGRRRGHGDDPRMSRWLTRATTRWSPAAATTGRSSRATWRGPGCRCSCWSAAPTSAAARARARARPPGSG